MNIDTHFTSSNVTAYEPNFLQYHRALFILLTNNTTKPVTDNRAGIVLTLAHK